MGKLLTTEDLAERWQVKKRTINQYRIDGIITPCKGIPAVRFNPDYIEELESVQLDKYSPILRKKHEDEIEQLRLEIQKRDNKIEELQSIISHIQAFTTEKVYSFDKAV